jgi:RNA polymerase sigma-70 factor (ECF subfamily)
VASVNSALQRARATLETTGLSLDGGASPIADAERDALADRYADAFQRYDIDALTALLADDATLSMPPVDMWLRGHAHIRAWLLGPGVGCRGSRLVPVRANGGRAFGQYRIDPAGGFAPFALHVLDIDPAASAITDVNAYLDVDDLFPLFGLPPHLDP